MNNLAEFFDLAVPYKRFKQILDLQRWLYDI